MKIIKTMALIALAVGALAACTSADGEPSGQKNAQQRAESRQNYQPQNDVEGHNYNARLRLADQPSTLIWCTAFPTNPNAKPITVPVVGKLTSGSKRPYPTSIVRQYENGGWYTPELPGPDGMYGTSGEYRFGFRPDGVYVDFYNLETYCTSEPTVFQKQSTVIDLGSSSINSADSAAQAALKTCRADNPDPSVPCAAAQAALEDAAK